MNIDRNTLVADLHKHLPPNKHLRWRRLGRPSNVLSFSEYRQHVREREYRLKARQQQVIRIVEA